MRKAGIALSAFALAVTLGACGDNGGSGDSNSGATTESSAPTGGNGSVAAANLAELAKSIGDQTAETNTAHMKLTGDVGGQSMTGEGDIQFGSADAAMTMDIETPEGALSMIVLDGALYMKMPQELEPGKPWIKIDSSSNAELAQALNTMNEEMSKNADPRAVLAEFEQSGEITDSKEEELDGRKTTHYTITVDVQKAVDAEADPTTKAEMQKLIDAGLKDFPVDVWIDEDDLPARIVMNTPTPDGAGGTVTTKVQVDYTKWGEPVNITAPPAEQIAQLPS